MVPPTPGVYAAAPERVCLGSSGSALWTGSASITWELVRKTGSWSLHRPFTYSSILPTCSQEIRGCRRVCSGVFLEERGSAFCWSWLQDTKYPLAAPVKSAGQWPRLGQSWVLTATGSVSLSCCLWYWEERVRVPAQAAWHTGVAVAGAGMVASGLLMLDYALNKCSVGDVRKPEPSISGLGLATPFLSVGHHGQPWPSARPTVAGERQGQGGKAALGPPCGASAKVVRASPGRRGALVSWDPWGWPLPP